MASAIRRRAILRVSSQAKQPDAHVSTRHGDGAELDRSSLTDRLRRDYITEHTANNTASYSTILNVSQEYHGTASLIVGYTQSTLIAHNEIGHVTYSGISLSCEYTSNRVCTK